MAAVEGRIRALFVTDGVGPLGTMDPASFEVSETAPAEPRYLSERMNAMGGVDPNSTQWDLVDLAIAQTLTHDGVVYAFTGEDQPIDSPAALFRY